MKIALHGRMGSGKTAIAEYLSEKHGFVHCHPGARCRALARELFADTSKATLNSLSDCMREIDQMVWIRLTLKGVGPSTAAVFDGVRFVSDYSYLRDAGFSLWSVRAPDELRHARLDERGQEF